MSWVLWAQIAALIVITGFMARHVMEARRQQLIVTMTQMAPAEKPNGPKLTPASDRGY